jgi:hypothetical protein
LIIKWTVTSDSALGLQDAKTAVSACGLRSSFRQMLKDVVNFSIGN